MFDLRRDVYVQNCLMSIVLGPVKARPVVNKFILVDDVNSVTEIELTFEWRAGKTYFNVIRTRVWKKTCLRIHANDITGYSITQVTFYDLLANVTEPDQTTRF